MKKFFRKIALMFLCSLGFLGVFSENTMALSVTSPEVNEAISFIESKHFYIGDVLSVEEISDGILINASYLPSGEISQINYRKSTNGDISLTIKESSIINTIIFKHDGTVYFDGIETTAFDPIDISNNYDSYDVLRSSSASYMTDTLPSGFSESGFETKKYGTANPVTIGLPMALEGMGASVLGAIIVSKLGWVNAEAVAQNIAGSLIGLGSQANEILYCADIYINNQQYPFQVAYKYVETWRLSGLPDWPHKTYRIETLL